MAIKIPSVKAPDLTRRSHNIDIPAGAFGEPVGAAIGKIGADTADAANKVNIALARFDERRSSTEANKAFKDLPISEGNALIAAKKDPNRNLPTFQPDYTAAQDKRNKAIIDGLSERAKPKFMLQYNTLQKNQALDAMNWALGQEVVEGRNEMNEAVLKLTSTASTVADTILLKKQVEDKIFEAHINNVLLDGRMRAKDPDVEALKQFRQIDFNKASSLVFNNPALLRKMIKENALPHLSDTQKKEFMSQSFTSTAGIEYRAKVSALDFYGEQNAMFRKKLNEGLLVGEAGYNELNVAVQSLQPQVDAGDEDAATQQSLLTLVRDSLFETDDVTQASKDKNALMNKLASIRATKLIKEMGLAENTTPDKGQQSVTYVHLLGRFNEMVVEVKRRGKDPEFRLREKGTITRLSDILDVQADSEVFRQKGLVSNEKHNAIIEDLLPIVRDKIEDDSFLEKKNMLGTKIKVKADIYSAAFTHVKETLAKSPELNTVVNQADAMLFAYQIARTTDKQEEADAFKRREEIFKAGDRGLKELYRQLIPEINHLTDDEIPNMIIKTEETADRTPVPVFKVPTQAVIDVMKANPNNANTKKIFIERYGQDQFDAITGALRRGMFKVEPTPAELHELGQAQAGQDADAKREFIDTHGQGWYNFHTGKPDDHKGI
jgi:hypothetical protein